MNLQTTIDYINSLPMSDGQKRNMIDQLRVADAKAYPAVKAVQGKIDAMGTAIPEGKVKSEAEMILKPGGYQYDAPPGGWPQRSADQSACTDGSRVWWATNSQGGGYFVDKAVADAVKPAPVSADWDAARQRMLDQARGETAPAAPATPAVANPIATAKYVDNPIQNVPYVAPPAGGIEKKPGNAPDD